MSKHKEILLVLSPAVFYFGFCYSLDMNRNELIEFLKSNDLWLKRSMGQNFLVKQKILPKIVAAAELTPTDTIVEIGPGLGILTEELAKKAGKVVAIEKDKRLAEALESRITNHELWREKVTIINQDALKIHNSEFIIHNSGFKVVANIPYNITSAVIRKFLEADNKPGLMVLMVQKEVAERICAKPGEMSLLSVSVQFYAEPEIVRIVKNTSFFPKPEVDSAIIKLKVKSKIPRLQNYARPDQISRRSFPPSAESACDRRNLARARNFAIQEFFRLVKFGFAARRKTLENNLAAGLHINKSEASDIIKKAGLAEKVRAQELSMEDWLELFRHSGLPPRQAEGETGDPESTIK